MTETFGSNGDFSTYNDEENDYVKGRKTIVMHNGDISIHDDTIQINEKTNEYIRDCYAERNRMDRKFPIAEKLLDCEIDKVQSTGRIQSREQKYADIYREKPLRVSQSVLVPIREHPKFNFVGKLLGPKGNSLRRLQEETLCKMTVLGRNSMRDRVKEEELRASKDPKYAHLNSDLHVEISTIAPPAEAYARIAYAMAELRKYLIPDSNDVIRQEQLRELMDNSGNTESDKITIKKMPYVQNNSVIGGTMGMVIAGGGVGNNYIPPGNSVNKNVTHQSYSGGSQQQQSSFTKNVLAPKQKVMSILEKARTAMDDSYSRGYDERLTYEQSSYDTYAYGHAPHSSGLNPVNNIGGSTRGAYNSPDYDNEYGRRAEYFQQSPSYGPAGAGIGSSGQMQSIQISNHSRAHVNR